MSEWQPIETAPKDGTVVDLWCERSWNPPVKFERRTSIYWDETHQCWRTESVLHFVEKTFVEDKIWAGWRWLKPTHWMPLPEPPKK